MRKAINYVTKLNGPKIIMEIDLFTWHSELHILFLKQ